MRRTITRPAWLPEPWALVDLGGGNSAYRRDFASEPRVLAFITLDHDPIAPKGGGDFSVLILTDGQERLLDEPLRVGRARELARQSDEELLAGVCALPRRPS